jgi:hypothetical protein
MSDLAHHKMSTPDKLAHRALATVLEAVSRSRRALDASHNKPGVHITHP